MDVPDGKPVDPITARCFTVAWYWLLLAAFIAICLRWLQIHTGSTWNINHLRHAHSHVAFLGWVFNGFFTIALQQFVPVEKRKAFIRLFLFLQLAVVGMAASFPLQGYGAFSIAFSTLHLAGSAVFAAWLWSSPLVGGQTRTWLRMALACMLLSGAGPLVLGPLAAMDLRDHPAYTLAIYFYLHCQYNGWFILFLLAAACQRWEAAGGSLPRKTRRAASISIGSGIAGSFLVSTFWLDPPWPVWLLGGAACAAQLWGFWLLRPLLVWGWHRLGPSLRAVLALVMGCLATKLLLQLLACLPLLAPLAHHRFIAVAFLHLVFLGMVTPALAGWAWQSGWIRQGWTSRSGAGLFLAGCLLTELVLVISALAGLGGHALANLSETLLASAGVIATGLILVRPTMV